MWIKVNSNQDTWNRGVDILSLKCDELGFSFREMPMKDVWIDWEIELRIGWKYNDKFQVQVKSSSKFPVTKDGKVKIKPLDRDHLEYWNDDINLPVFIVGVETNTWNIYWCDTREYYEKIKKNKKQKTVQSYSSPENQLNKWNKENFISFLKKLDKHNAEKILIRNSPLEKLRMVGKKKWYKVSEDPSNQSLELMHTELSKEHNLNWNMFFEKKIGENKYKIKDFSLNIWSENIFDWWEWTVELSEVKEDLKISLSTEWYEYFLSTERYWAWDYSYIESKKWEVFYFKTKMNRKTLDLKDTYTNLHFDFENAVSIEDVLYFLNFIQEAKTHFTLNVFIWNWRKSPILWWELNIDGLQIEFLIDFLEYLIEIEIRYKVKFSPESIFSKWEINYEQMVELFPYLKAICKWEYKIKWKSILKFKPTNINAPEFQKEQLAFRNTIKIDKIYNVNLDLDLTIEWEWPLNKKENGNFTVETQEVRVFL